MKLIPWEDIARKLEAKKPSVTALPARTKPAGTKVDFVVHCSRRKGAGTLYTIGIKHNVKERPILRKKLVRLAFGKTGEAAKSCTVAGSDMTDPKNLTHGCMSCGHKQIIICAGCGLPSCGTNHEFWSCAHCDIEHDPVNLTKTASVTAHRKNQHVVSQQANQISRDSTPILPKNST